MAGIPLRQAHLSQVVIVMAINTHRSVLFYRKKLSLRRLVLFQPEAISRHVGRLLRRANPALLAVTLDFVNALFSNLPTLDNLVLVYYPVHICTG